MGAAGVLEALRDRIRADVARDGLEPVPTPDVAMKDLERAIDGWIESVEAGVPFDEQGDQIERAVRCASRLAAGRASAIGRWDAQQGWAVDEAAAGKVWLRWRCHLRRDVADREVDLARALRDMPLVHAALREGAITVEHVGVLARARSWHPASFERDEALLLGFARDAWFQTFEQKVRMWKHVNDPDKAEEEAVDRYERRRLHASETFDDMGVVDALFNPVGFAIYKTELDRLEHDLWEADWADARERLGDTATAGDLSRTPAQRRLDAQVEMARRSAAMPRDAKQARALVTVLVGYETLHGRICELSSGTVLTPGEVLPLLNEADIERAVFDASSRLIDLGRRSRLFVGGARRALDLRDRGCGHGACDVPADRCEGDHFPVGWADGGETNPDNGRLRCPTHHPNRRRPKRPMPPPDEPDLDDP